MLARTPINDKELAWLAFDELRRGFDVAGYTRLRIALAEAQNWRCCYCGCEMFAGLPFETIEDASRKFGLQLYSKASHRALTYRKATTEHLVRQIDGGGGNLDNLVSACGWCNPSRQDRDPMVWYEHVQLMIKCGAHPNWAQSETKMKVFRERRASDNA